MTPHIAIAEKERNDCDFRGMDPLNFSSQSLSCSSLRLKAAVYLLF